MFRIFIFLLIVLVSCSDGFYDREYYEKISSITIPANAKILESIDNGEFVTASTFHLDSLDLIKFAESFEFTALEENSSLRLLSNSYLKGDKPNLESGKGYLYKSGYKGKNSWLYVIDIQKGLLWAEIQYPDAGGT